VASLVDDEGLSRPLWTALSDRANALERLLVRLGQVAGVLCIVIASIVTFAQQAPMGPPLLLLCVLWTLLYTATLTWWDVPAASGVRRYLLPAFETLLPAFVLVVMHERQGTAYALGSWVPPQLAAVFIFGSILRLRTDVPLVMGVVAGASYGLAYGLFLYPELDSTELLHSPSMQAVRSLSLALTGVAASLGVRALRSTILSADRDVRSRELFGKYRLEDDIASGGMGRVVLATYAPEGGFERKVAIKLVHPHLAKDPMFVERFRTEAELSSRLHHPGIVAALDFGKANDTWFFAMEYVDGRPLADILKDHRMGRRLIEPRLVLAMGLQLADALDHAHAHAAGPDGRLLRVLHRDLTPSNILLDRSGQFKISDFGVARAIGGGDSLHTDHLVGKPSYVCPEALRNFPIDERADLWSLGVVLYEAMANKRLFKRQAESATLLAVLEDPVPPLDEVRPGLGAAWQLFFDQALARDPEHRFRTASDLARALRELQAVEGRATPEEVAELLTFGEEELPLDDTTADVDLRVPPPREHSATGARPRIVHDADGPPSQP
jgi:serine/threonine-protein kinase